MPKTEKQSTEASFDQALLSATSETALEAIKSTQNAEALIDAWVKALEPPETAG